MNLKSRNTNVQAVSLLLRIGLAAVFLYAAVEAFRQPIAWVSFVPDFTTKFVAAKTSLDIISVIQIGLAAWLLTGKYLRLAAAVAIALFAGIVIFNLDSLYVTFRDFGLICMALALFFIKE